MYKIILLLKYYYKWQHLVQFVKKSILIAIAQSGTGKVIDIRNILGITNNQFNPYKKRLEKKGLIDGSYGLAELALPMFEEYLLDKVE